MDNNIKNKKKKSYQHKYMKYKSKYLMLRQTMEEYSPVILEEKFAKVFPSKYSSEELKSIVKQGYKEKASIENNHDKYKQVDNCNPQIPGYIIIFKDNNELGIINITKVIQKIPIFKTVVSHHKSMWEIWHDKEIGKKFQKEILDDKDPNEKVWELTKKYNYRIPTTFHPVYAKAIYEYFNAEKVVDPSSGWGDRIVGAFYAGVKEYVGFDPNLDLRSGYINIMNLLGVSLKEETPGSLVFSNNYKIYSLPFNLGSENFLQENYFDFVFTSPPFFEFEIYNKNNPKYIDWIDEFYTPLITQSIKALKPNKHLALYIADTSSGKISDFLCDQVTKISSTDYIGKIGLKSFTHDVLRDVWVYKKM